MALLSAPGSGMTSRPRHTLERHGCRLSWFASGEGAPVLLIQGTGIGGVGWSPQLDALSPAYRCIAFDNRGCADSQPLGSTALTLELMADDALAVLDAEKIDRAHVVGHSLGGLIALYLAHRAPARVRSLSLLCTFATGAIPTRVTPWVAWVGLRTQLGTRRMRRNAFLEMIVPRQVLDRADRDALARRYGEVFGRDLADQPKVAMKQLAAMRGADATGWLAELADVPTLVVSAAEDRIAPPEGGRALAAGIPGARYVELPGASHAVVIEQAAEVNALLREHLAAADARGPRA